MTTLWLCLLLLLLEAQAVALRSVLRMTTTPLTGRTLVIESVTAPGERFSVAAELSRSLRQHAGNGAGDVGVTLLRQSGSDVSTDAELEGVQVVEADFATGGADAAAAALGGATFSYIVDNWSSSAEDATVVTQLAQKQQTQRLVSVCAAATSLYQQADVIPLVEKEAATDAETAAAAVEATVVGAGVPYTLVRVAAECVYGGAMGSPALDYFVNRAARGLHVPLPLHGEQVVALTNIHDVAAMLVAVLQTSEAAGETFNCSNEQCITYRGLSDVVHKAVHGVHTTAPAQGKHLYFEPLNYDVPLGLGGRFPFSRKSMPLCAAKARRMLGWTPQRNVLAEIKTEAAACLGRTGFSSGVDTWKQRSNIMHDLEIIASKDSAFVFEYPFFFEEKECEEPPIILE